MCTPCRRTLAIQQALRQIFGDHDGVHVLDTDIPAVEAYPRAATLGLPVHRVEYRRPATRVAPAALETIRSLACELFPQWIDRFHTVAGKPRGRRSHAKPA